MSASGSSPAPVAPFCSGTKGNGAAALCAFARAGVDAGLRAADMELGSLVWAGPCGARRTDAFVRP
eukprot:5763889-Lingulodinium_polyedra.AAC.1